MSEQTSLNDQSFDLAIVGAGIVGASAALCLGQQGYRVALIDRQSQPDLAVDMKRYSVNDYSARVSALTPANVAFFHRCGAWEHLPSSLVQPYQYMEVWEELGGGRIHFDSAEYQAQALGYIIENHVLLAACMRAIGEQNNVHTFFEKDITSCALISRECEQARAYQLSFSDQSSVYANLLIGADGANSSIRKQLNLATREWDYDQEAIVCTVEMEMSHGMKARQRFAESGPVAFLPLNNSSTEGASSDASFCSIVWSIDTNKAAHIFSLPEVEFKRQLAAQIEGELGAVKSVSKRFKFPLRQRHAKSYVADQAILMGDAAHSIHPLAGQGLNLGLDDVQALISIAEDAKKKGYELSSPILLKRYERARKSENFSMMLGMEGFKRLFGATDPIVRLIRNLGVDAMNRHTFIKAQIAKKAMGLQ